MIFTCTNPYRTSTELPVNVPEADLVAGAAVVLTGAGVAAAVSATGV